MDFANVRPASRKVTGPLLRKIEVALGETPTGQRAASLWAWPQSRSGAINLVSAEQIDELISALEATKSYLAPAGESE